MAGWAVRVLVRGCLAEGAKETKRGPVKVAAAASASAWAMRAEPIDQGEAAAAILSAEAAAGRELRTRARVDLLVTTFAGCGGFEAAQAAVQAIERERFRVLGR